MSIGTVAKNFSAALKARLYYAWGNLRAGLQGVRLGPGARVSPHARVAGAYFVGEASIGRDVVLGEGSYVSSGYVMSGRIGKWCSIGYGVIIGPSEHDPDSWTTSPTFAVKQGHDAATAEKAKPPPVIEDEVWIAANVVVLRGVQIGRGSVVAAGAVVTKDIPAMEIWGGVPARKLRPRASRESGDPTTGGATSKPGA